MTTLYELPVTPAEGRKLGAFTCASCHRVLCVKPGEMTTGYGRTKSGKRHCFDCCGKRDAKAMKRTGRATLYLSGPVGVAGLSDETARPWTVSNWPGTLKIEPWHVREGRHNIAGRRFDCWFNFDGETWHGVTYGTMTQICHARRVSR